MSERDTQKEIGRERHTQRGDTHPLYWVFVMSSTQRNIPTIKQNLIKSEIYFVFLAFYFISK